MSPRCDSSRRGEYLSVLLDGIAAVDRSQDALIRELCLDSRKVRRGSLFFAIPGLDADGRAYIENAIQAGARAVVYEADGWRVKRRTDVPQIGVPDLNRRISAIADVFFNQPSRKLHVVGITGTNGKSSCALLTAQALETLGHRCGIVGTLGFGFPDNLEPCSLTTPDSISLQRHIARLESEGAQYLCLEVSSHSLDQSRADGVRFGTVVFTNLSRDHLDYHGTMERYRAAKARLFKETPASHAVLNVDDEFGRSLLGRTQALQEISFGQGRADVQLLKCATDDRGLTVSIDLKGERIEVRSALLGRFNGMNLTAAAAMLHSLGIPSHLIESALHSVMPISGRLERVCVEPDQPAVYIDFAHTPEGLRQALSSVREITDGELWCVFGCGGDRDKEKRPLMGMMAERFADRIIVTDDNPRSEPAAAIASDIVSGMQLRPLVEHDRRMAIRLAIAESQPGDSILIAGKGHETEQIIAGRHYPFSDRQVAEEFLRSARC